MMVAHRFSTIQMADRVLVLEDGKLAEQGTQAQLCGGRVLTADCWKWRWRHEAKQVFRWLLNLLRPFRWLIAGTVLLSASTVLANVGLLSVSAVLISMAALQPPLLDLMVYIVGVRFFWHLAGIAALQ